MSGAALLARLGPLPKAVRGALMADQPLGPVTWFRVGGPADLLFQPADEQDLALFLAELPDDVPVTVMGLGSNLLVRDGGIEGVVIRLSARGFGHVEPAGDRRLRVGAAAADKRVSLKAHESGIGGFAFYFGIPGGIGGALRMNAGANGTETRERVVEVTAIDRQGRRHVISNEAMGYAYRHSSAREDLIFTEALMEGVPQDAETIRAEMDAVQEHREAAQPVKSRTGGSTFKNPPGHSAWKLVDAAGCRGLQVGDAQVSPMHCNFLINTGQASAHDIETLGETVRARVLETSGVRLDWEIKRLGRFGADLPVEPFLARG